ncbi:MAG: AEC family transporter [Pseudomonadota bacterium]
MLQVLTHNILPIFAMLALGFAMGRGRIASASEARALNRIAFLVLQPPLIFLLITQNDLGSFDLYALTLYFVAEAVTFIFSYAAARYLFRREIAEAWLLAMCVVFVNSLLYVGPISYLIYGQTAALPITAIVVLDATVWFSFFIISMELIVGRPTKRVAARRIFSNPVIVTIALSLGISLLGLDVTEPVKTAANFAGSAAAPLTLFALGVTLSAHSLTPNPTVIGISALKLLFFPFLVWACLAVFEPGNPWSDLFVLNAAGPSGMMAFALAMLYGVRTDCIAPVIIWTSTLSLLSLAWLA